MDAANNGHDGDVVDEIKGMTELYNPLCCLVDSVKKDSDRFLEATDLDGKKTDLHKTYLDFNRKLWTGKIKEDEKTQTEETIRNKSERFQAAVINYGIKDISEKHCFLYREFQINGVARPGKKKKQKIESALTNIINFPDYIVSLKTTKVKSNKKDQRSEMTTKSWKEATQDYLDRYYPTEGVFRIPPSLEYEDELSVKGSRKPLAKDLLLVPDDEVLKNRVAQSTTGNNKKAVMKALFEKRRGDKAESDILIAFEKWGRDTKQNMFIFGGYKYSDYLKNVTNEFKSLTSEQGEFDVLIISEQLGIIFVEVKGSVGAKHATKESGRGATGIEDGGEIDAAVMNGTTEGGNDHRRNDVTSESSRGKLDSERCGSLKNGHDHRSSDTAVDHANSEEVCNPTDTLDRNRNRKHTSLETSTDGSSSENSKKDDKPNDPPKLKLSGEKEIVTYKETTTRSIQSEIQDGWRQIMKGNFVFREMNRDLGFVKRLPFKAFVGLPFLSDPDLNDACICSHHQKYLIYSEVLDRLQEWLLENHFPEGYEKKAMSREEFRELAARFAGLASAVTTELDTIKFTNRKMMCTFLTPEQTAILQNQQKHAVLFGDYGTGKTFVLTRKATSLVSLSGKPSSKFEKKQQILPTESTINVVHIIPCADLSNFKSCYGVTFSDQAQDIDKFVSPNYKGNSNIRIYKSFLDFYLTVTGSSPDRNVKVGIMMVIHAVEKALQDVGEKTVIGVEQQNISKGNFAAKQEEEIENKTAISEKVQERKEVHHFFFDEFPVHPLKAGALKSLHKFFLDGLKGSYLWISVATHSLGVSSDKDPADVLREELSMKNEEDVLFCYLNDVMRVSTENYKMIKQIETFIDKGHFEHSNLGHMLKGIKPKLFRLPERKCEIFENNPLDCECQVTNLASTLGRILDSVVDKGEPLVVKILIYYVMSTPMFRRLRALLTRVAQVLDIKLMWNTIQSRKEIDALTTSSTVINGRVLKKNEKSLSSTCPAEGSETAEVKKLSTEWKIQVVDQRTFAGCETPVLIFIDPFGMRHWFKRGDGKGSGYHSLIFTRCTGHFILVTWPDDEAKKMWNQHLDEYEAETRESDASESFKNSRYEYIDKGRNATDNCLQMLLDKCLIINMNNKAD